MSERQRRSIGGDGGEDTVGGGEKATAGRATVAVGVAVAVAVGVAVGVEVEVAAYGVLAHRTPTP